MAKKRRYTRPTLDPATIIEVVATKGTKGDQNKNDDRRIKEYGQETRMAISKF